SLACRRALPPGTGPACAQNSVSKSRFSTRRMDAISAGKDSWRIMVTTRVPKYKSPLNSHPCAGSCSTTWSSAWPGVAMTSKAYRSVSTFPPTVRAAAPRGLHRIRVDVHGHARLRGVGRHAEVILVQMGHHHLRNARPRRPKPAKPAGQPPRARVDQQSIHVV